MVKNQGNDFIKSLDLQLKRKAGKRTWIGKNILADYEKSAARASDRDFANHVKTQKYPEKLNNAFQRGLKRFKGQFFIEVYLDKEKIHKKGIVLVPIERQSCPFPTWNKHVYICNTVGPTMELLWNVPSRRYCENPYLIPLDIEGRSELLKNIDEFTNGRYTQIFKDLTKHEEDE